MGKKADVLNKLACVKYFNFEAKRETVIEEAEKLWKKAIMSYNQHFYSCFNLGMSKFLRGEFDIDQLIADFHDDVFINKSQGQFTEACLLLAAGKRQEGLDVLGAYIEGFKTKATKKRRGLNAKQKQKLQIAECLKDAVTVKDPDCVTFPVNFKVAHNHTSKVLQVAYSRDGSTLASLSATEVSLWRIKPASA